MTKYEVWFCSCGRIHIMPWGYYDWIEEDWMHRSIIQVCQHCGKAQRINLDANCDSGYDICKSTVRNVELSEEELQNTRILFNTGINVPVISGGYASYCTNGIWFDEHDNKTEVDTEMLIKGIRDEEILRSIAGYVSGINWKGTAYEV